MIGDAWSLFTEASHDESPHDYIGEMGEWDLFGFLPSHPCHACFAPRGRLYLLLCHQEKPVSLVTPCIQNGARFEVRGSDGTRTKIDGIDFLYAWLRQHMAVDPPPRKQFIAAARWFLDAPELRARLALQEAHSPSAPVT